jgi:hypothetical protein
VSPACVHCYADTWAKRVGFSNIWRRHGPRRLMSDAYWRGPLAWNRKVEAQGLLRATIAKLEHEQLSMDLQKFLEKAAHLPLVARKISFWGDHPIRAAQELLSRAKITKVPVDVDHLANSCGVGVLPWKFDDSLSGLVVELDVGPVIGVNSRHPEVRRRFTLAHELGHHLLQHRDRFYVDLKANTEHGDPPEYHSRHERDANEFAANVLMPAAPRWFERSTRDGRT